MQRHTGEIYLNPDVRRADPKDVQWIGTEFEEEARLRGAPTAPIEHLDGGGTSHL